MKFGSRISALGFQLSREGFAGQEQLKAQGPSRNCNESQEEEEEHTRRGAFWRSLYFTLYKFRILDFGTRVSAFG